MKYLTFPQCLLTLCLGSVLYLSQICLQGASSPNVVLNEKVESQMQGGVVKLPLRPTSSVMRMRFNQGDGQL